MSRSFIRLFAIVFPGSLLAPLVTIAASRRVHAVAQGHWFGIDPLLIAMVVVVPVFSVIALAFVRRMEPWLESNALEQAEFLHSIPSRYLDLAIFGSAAISLFLELAIIRWQSTVFEFFAFYKNFSLLACFAGLGLGYAMADRKRVPLVLTFPLLCWEFLLMIGMRFGLTPQQWQSLRIFPITEQLNMGLIVATKPYEAFQTCFVMAVVFMLTALAFIPIGQLCGVLMERRGEKLRAYGYNLLGSLAGVLLMLLASALWTPPLVWFLIPFAAILLFYVRRYTVVALGGGFIVLALILLAWPVDPMWQRIYSPYQLLEVGRDEKTGYTLVRAAGHYYQRVHNLPSGNLGADEDAALRRTRMYYDLPYVAFGRAADVAVVGAGTGNDVAAALRSGAHHVDAIEIDPAIQAIGAYSHPEHPYQDPRVRAVVDDARSFLRNTTKTYDLIVYGLLDSHTLLSHASNVRLDSFVYTVEGFREARARLRPDGMLSVSFSLMNGQMGRKIFLMMKEAFDGRPPICFQAGYDGSAIVFIESNGSPLSGLILTKESGFVDRTAFYADSKLQEDVSTDDWPFLYMPRRVYPLSYVYMVALILVLSLFLIRGFGQAPRFAHAEFFLLGAGFMLVETKAITELGLTFGNSWQIIGVVIAGILVMAFLANAAVQFMHVKSSTGPYVLLLLTLMLGWVLARHGGLPSTWAGRIGTATLLTCPMFFSGIVFSTLLRSKGEISSVMATNLFGAMCGGLLEYNSMYFGFQFLYLLAAGIYLVAFGSGLVGMGRARLVANAASPGASE